MTLAPWIVACQAPVAIEFPRPEYRSGLPFPSPRDLPHPGTEPEFQKGQTKIKTTYDETIYMHFYTYMFLINLHSNILIEEK